MERVLYPYLQILKIKSSLIILKMKTFCLIILKLKTLFLLKMKTSLILKLTNLLHTLLCQSFVGKHVNGWLWPLLIV